jgi:hypothetical protein
MRASVISASAVEKWSKNRVSPPIVAEERRDHAQLHAVEAQVP